MKDKKIILILMVIIHSQVLYATSIDARLELLSKDGIKSPENQEDKATFVEDNTVTEDTPSDTKEPGLIKKGLEKITKSVEQLSDYAQTDLVSQAGEIAQHAGEQAKKIANQVTEQAHITGKQFINYILPKIKELFNVVGKKLISWGNDSEDQALIEKTLMPKQMQEDKESSDGTLSSNNPEISENNEKDLEKASEST
ncbi:hypothetical protein P618_200514 [Holospora obtusa F1]|uniref:Uncharacterized protein n=1 Tax=Holospora obtusa F1 TaxID=1399147 RepID=W6TED6_HOLOB|nr:hypothetical protein [Holospora obtusa]ETZ07306.1 hypothetical protein P618_200514 [Holospora obtusa F1]